MNLALVCVAGGRGERFGGGDKLAERISGRTVLEHSLAVLRQALPSAPLVVVLPAGRLERWRAVLDERYPEAELVVGGLLRQDSVRAGVEQAASGGAEVVLVHDAARPAVAAADIRGLVGALGSSSGAVLCAEVDDTVKRVDGDGLVVETLDRDLLRLAQTPQIFRVEALRHGWDESERSRIWTDEAAMLESLGMRVRSVVAGRPNPKLTTVEDLRLIRLLLEERQ